MELGRRCAPAGMEPAPYVKNAKTQYPCYYQNYTHTRNFDGGLVSIRTEACDLVRVAS